MTSRGAIVGVLLAPWFVTAQPEPQHQTAVHQYPGDHLAIAVPADWVEISKAELDQISASVREAAPNAKPQPYNRGFQVSAESRYPRVLIQVKTVGRWSEKVFAEMAKLPSMKEEIQRQVGSVSPSFAALNIQMDKLTYDPVKRIVWLRAQLTGEDGQTVQSLSGLHPTGVGSVQVHCYAPAADFERYAPLFSEMITSVQIDDDWKYRERSALSRAFGSLSDIGADAAIGVAVGVAIALAGGWLRRRKTAAGEARG